MKNIHILPTDKPSQLYNYNDTPNILFIDILREREPVSVVQHHNIYITSNEEIKVGGWYYLPRNNSVYKCNEDPTELNLERRLGVAKIILATDQDLIKDGVQSIDDEFLEWFVKNPSCESAMVEEKYRKCCRNTDGKNENCIEPINCEGWLSKEYERPYKTTCDKIFEGYKIIIPKQETLEEAAEKWFKEIGGEASFMKAIEFGVKWQQEKIYNQIKELYDNENITGFTKRAYAICLDIVEQFKNK